MILLVVVTLQQRSWPSFRLAIHPLTLQNLHPFRGTLAPLTHRFAVRSSSSSHTLYLRRLFAWASSRLASPLASYILQSQGSSLAAAPHCSSSAASTAPCVRMSDTGCSQPWKPPGGFVLSRAFSGGGWREAAPILLQNQCCAPAERCGTPRIERHRETQCSIPKT